MDFRFSLFKEQLTSEFTSFEFSFLVRSFRTACFYFFAFAILITGMLYVESLYPDISSSVFIFGLIFSLIMTFLFAINFAQYRSNPMSVTSGFVNKLITYLFFSYAFVFFILVNQAIGLIAENYPKSNMQNFGNKSIFVGSLFSLSIFAYLIPAAIGWRIKNHQKVLSLSKFLQYCYMFYVILMLASLFAMFFATNIGGIFLLLYFLLGCIVFTSPILSIYRLKNTVRYIDYTNEEAVKKWEIFFAIEILYQLLQIALFILRTIIIFLSNSSRR